MKSEFSWETTSKDKIASNSNSIFGRSAKFSLRSKCVFGFQKQMCRGSLLQLIQF